jgi:peptidylprolyl isomerase
MRPLGWLLLAAGLVSLGCRSKTDKPTEAVQEAGAALVSTAPAWTPPPRPKEIPAPPDVGAPPSDAQKTASGLVSKILTPGTGKEHPRPNDRVTVHHTGWTKSGQMFDSSMSRGAPITFRVDSVIRGWMEVLQLMVAGEKRRVWVPAALAYGERPSTATADLEHGGTPWGDLVFEIELIEILR